MIIVMLFVSFVAAPAMCASLDESVFGRPEPAGPALDLHGDGSSRLLPSARFAVEYGPPTRSAFREAAWSLVIPGLAQHRMGREVRSSFYFALEGLTWLAIGGFLWQGYSEEQAYKDYAVAYAGIVGTDHADDYYEKIGQWMSSDGPGGYNEYILREARDLYYPNLDEMEQYYASNMIPSDQSWLWRTERAFSLFGDLRSSSRAAYRRALYSAVFALTMRIVSTVDAARLARSDIQAERSAFSLGIEQRGDGIALSMSGSF
jgi:hypothetical protein